MSGQRHRFQELSVVRADDDGEGWVVSGGRFEGLFGSDKTRLWQFMADGTLRFADLTARKFYDQLKIGLDAPEKASVYSGNNRLWIVPHDKAQGSAFAIDLESAEIAASISGVSARQFGLGRVTQNGSLVCQKIARIDDVVYDQFYHVDAETLEVSESRVACRKAPDTTNYIHFFDASPCGTYWLRIDHTHFPMVEYADTPGGRPRKYFGLTLQVWSGWPLKFEKRIVVAWLKAENLPDQTFIPDIGAVKELNQQLKVEAEAQRKSSFGFTSRLFGRKSTSSAKGDPDQRWLAAMAEDAMPREPVYVAMSTGMHCPDADPEADLPGRKEFGDAAHDDELWRAVTTNMGYVFQNALRHSACWEGEEIVWFDRVGHLICVGMDGAVSPQIWYERAGMQRMVVPFPNLPGRIEMMEGRRLHAVKLPSNPNLPSWSKIEQTEGGSLIVDGSPTEPRYEPVCVSKDVDGWLGPESIPAHHFNEEKDRKTADAFRKNRSTITIPLKGIDPAARIEAICAYRDLLDASFFDRADGSTINVGFELEGRIVPEVKFFLAFDPDDKSWAYAPLLDLVARYADLKGRSLDTVYQCDGENGSLLAQAAHRLAEMDPGAIPTLIAYGEGIDGGHEYYFAGETMPAVVKHHGWSDDVIAFVAWALAFNYYNTYDFPSTIWQQIGLGKALMRRPAKEAAGFVYEQLAPFVEAGRLDWHNFACLRDELGEKMDAWEREFFGKLVTLIGEEAFEVS